MKYSIRGEKLEVTEALKSYAIEKLSKLDKYLDNSDNVEAKILLNSKNNKNKVEVTILVNNYFLRAEELQDDMYTALDLISDKIERQFRKYKTKLMSKQKRASFDESEIAFTEEESEKDVVKVKKVFLKPMDRAEAIIQMELLGHTFFVFKDSNTKNICVIYKRKDGDYGVIETE